MATDIADTPEMKAEALLGAGRAALAQGSTAEARRILRNAQAHGRGTSSAPWISNALAVAATLDADYETAESHFAEALRLSSEDPRITANFARMLLADGRLDEAARVYAGHAPSYWMDEDGRIPLPPPGGVSTKTPRTRRRERASGRIEPSAGAGAVPSARRPRRERTGRQVRVRRRDHPGRGRLVPCRRRLAGAPIGAFSPFDCPRSAFRHPRSARRNGPPGTLQLRVSCFVSRKCPGR